METLSIKIDIFILGKLSVTDVLVWGKVALKDDSSTFDWATDWKQWYLSTWARLKENKIGVSRTGMKTFWHVKFEITVRSLHESIEEEVWGSKNSDVN